MHKKAMVSLRKCLGQKRGSRWGTLWLEGPKFSAMSRARTTLFVTLQLLGLGVSACVAPKSREDSPAVRQGREKHEEAVRIMEDQPELAVQILKTIPPAAGEWHRKALALIETLNAQICEEAKRDRAEFLSAFSELREFIARHPDRYAEILNKLGFFESEHEHLLDPRYRLWIEEARSKAERGLKNDDPCNEESG